MRAMVLGFLLALPGVVAAQSGVTGAVAASAPLNQNFAGSWAGQLEYKDYGSGERVFLPTWVEAVAEPDGSTITLRYTYDDGPAKVVHEVVSLVIAGDVATISAGKDTPVTKYKVAGLEVFRKVNRGTLVLTGTGMDNGKPVELRITITLRRNLYTWVKETRAPGTDGAFVFRDGYTFTRVAAPTG